MTVVPGLLSWRATATCALRPSIREKKPSSSLPVPAAGVLPSVDASAAEARADVDSEAVRGGVAAAVSAAGAPPRIVDDHRVSAPVRRGGSGHGQRTAPRTCPRQDQRSRWCRSRCERLLCERTLGRVVRERLLSSRRRCDGGAVRVHRPESQEPQHRREADACNEPERVPALWRGDDGIGVTARCDEARDVQPVARIELRKRVRDDRGRSFANPGH